MKIEKLTAEQESRLQDYESKWVQIGLSTEQASYEETVDIINAFQTKVLQKAATPVYIAPNPKKAWDAVGFFLNQKTITSGMLKKTDFDENSEFIWPYQDGSFFASIFSFYDFFIEEKIVSFNEELKEKWEAWRDTSRLGLIYPLDNICVVSQKPTAIHINENGLHNESGMALEYEGWGFYSLNGVRVPKELVMTSVEDLDIAFFKKENNADIKAEFVRKFGVERMLDFGKKIDSYKNYNHEWWTKSEYELWDMASIFEGLNYQPYLKMQNQTTQIWHVEAVSPDCTTLAEAIKERFGGRDFTIKNIA